MVDQMPLVWHDGHLIAYLEGTLMRIWLTTFGLLSACENISKDDPQSEDTGEVDTDTDDLEPGCFVVDGGAGYALLNDAISMANDGSTITMDGCDSHHEEVVNVSKPLSIVGPGSGILH